MSYALAPLAAEYAAEWQAMVIDPKQLAEITAIAARLHGSMPIYRAVEKMTGVPASIVAVIHNRESDQDFKTHLHNGDSLSARTVHVPAGRIPAPAQPPFSWTDSAIDALRLEGFDRIRSWTVEQAAFSLEQYNGFGYRQYHAERSPYLWAASNEQQAGKYIADGEFNRTGWDSQIGCMPVLAALWKLDESLALPLAGASPQPAPQPVPAPVPTPVPLPPLPRPRPTPSPDPAPIPVPPPVSPSPVTGTLAAIIVALAAGVALYAHQVVAWIQHLFGG